MKWDALIDSFREHKSKSRCENDAACELEIRRLRKWQDGEEIPWQPPAD